MEVGETEEETEFVRLQVRVLWTVSVSVALTLKGNVKVTELLCDCKNVTVGAMLNVDVASVEIVDVSDILCDIEAKTVSVGEKICVTVFVGRSEIVSVKVGIVETEMFSDTLVVRDVAMVLLFVSGKVTLSGHVSVEVAFTDDEWEKLPDVKGVSVGAAVVEMDGADERVDESDKLAVDDRKIVSVGD